ncbi:hydrolase, NUDIX family [Clostridiales bacterium oral taxon 876 str. F0540]|nr:hydrolase, NUDIX family [Clostridiales bacterium oral taxon 876 str. F0540]
MIEYWDIYDESKNKTGQLHQRGLELEDGQYHLVVAIWIRNKNNEILLTKRNPRKLWGDYWECTGGAVIAGEDSIIGAKREVFEEIGIEIIQESLKFLGTTMHKTWFTDTYLLEEDILLSNLKLQSEEVIDVKWVNFDEFNSMCMKDLIVPVVLEQFKHFRNEIFQK